MTKVVVSDALGNEVTLDTEESLLVAGRTALRLFDHIKAVPSTGPGGAGQIIGFRHSDPGWSDLRGAGRLEIA